MIPKPVRPEKERRPIAARCANCGKGKSRHADAGTVVNGACAAYVPKRTLRAPIVRKAAAPKRKAKPRRERKTGRAALARLADKLAGQIVRARGKCEACGAGPQAVLQWAHLFSRRYHAVRWNLLNSACLCRGCHFRFTVRPLEWDEWMREALGLPAYDELRRIALKNERVDLVETLARLRAEASARGVE